MEQLRPRINIPDAIEPREINRYRDAIDMSDLDDDVKEALEEFFERVVEYTRETTYFLNEMTRDVYQAINNRHLIGDLADLPSASEAGLMFLANDQTPEELYISDGTNWHRWDSELV